MDKFIPSENQIERLKELASKGLPYIQIARELGIKDKSIPKRLIQELGIPYKHFQVRDVNWTEEMDSNLRRMHESPQFSKNDISEFLRIPISHVTKRIKELSLLNPKKFHPTPNQVSHVREMAERGSTRVEIANFLGVDRCALKTVFRDHNIVLRATPRNKQGKNFSWTTDDENRLRELYKSKNHNVIDIANIFGCSDGAIVKKAKTLGLTKEFPYPITLCDREYLMNNHKTKTIEQMVKERRSSEYTIIWKLNKLELTKEVPIHPKRTSMPRTEEFWKDYTNPNMSHVDVGRKYSIDRTTIGKWRGKDFGNEFKVMINTWLHKSENEIKFENILEDIPITFEYQKALGKWRFDYYLGFNILVEVQSYWHLNDRQKERDATKKKFAEERGFQVVEIWDHDIENIQSTKTMLLNKIHDSLIKTIAVLGSNTKENNSVNLQ